MWLALMKSHHSPPKRLLEQFQSRDTYSRRGRTIWIYEKGARPRPSHGLKNEGAERSYFSGATSGETESEVDERFARTYEVPFTNILPKLLTFLPLNESDIRICSRYVAHLFRRSLAFRNGSQTLFRGLNEEYGALAHDPLGLRAYGAKLSLISRKPVSLPELRQALINVSLSQANPTAAHVEFVTNIGLGTEVYAKKFQELNWSVLRSASAENFLISDTPVISKSVDFRGETNYGMGITKAGAEWFLPLSPRAILRGSARQRSRFDVETSEVRDLNLGQIFTMVDRLYGPSADLWIDSLVQRWGGCYKYFADVYKTDNNTADERDDFDRALMDAGLPLVSTSSIFRIN